jgi:hypothetical protein
VGAHVDAVRYVDTDYREMERVGPDAGPRRVPGAEEWEVPSWLVPTCHSLDFGVELDVRGAEGVAVTSQIPGWNEGLVLYRGVLRHTAVRADGNHAVWDVTSWGPWPQILANPIADVELRYEPWDDPEDSGFWCRLITVTLGTFPLRFLLAEGQTGVEQVRPSADNVAVLFPQHRLPAWASGTIYACQKPPTM